MFKVGLTHQRLILGSLVVLWVAVLPWLCWGGWSNPHHPHPNPHFVFAPPPPLEEGQHALRDAPYDYGEQETLAGVARPDTLLLALLALVLPVNRVMLALHVSHFTRHIAPQWSHTTTLAVPTPPPRAFLSSYTSFAL